VETVFPRNTGAFSLSPDNKYLAFWMYDETNTNWSLSTLNLQTKVVIDTCIKSKYFPKTPVWSPDSQNIAVEVFGKGGSSTEVLLIEPERKLAVQIAKDARPVGWLK